MAHLRERQNPLADISAIMKFSLMFFASSEAALFGDKYRLVLDSARFADANGFSSIWVPERHFTEYGSLYPNPAVLHAAVAASTRRIKLLAGSVVAPIHHPIRIAEEWSMVDNLSNGRVGISFASGWNPGDFVFAPDKYSQRHEEMFAAIRTVQHLWRGGTLDARSGSGEPHQIRIYPTPVQRELPIWLTAAGNPQTFIRAGEIGANLLTHVLDQDPEQLAQKIGLYREARAKHGYPAHTGTVSVMLHTFVGDDAERVRTQAREPFCSYIRRNIGLLNALAQSRGRQVDVKSMPARELDEFVLFLYERFAHSRGLIGTPESCQALIAKLAAMGVDEVACLLDFGPSVELILDSLPHLLRLTDLYRLNTGARQARLDLNAVRQRCAERMTGADLDANMQACGIHIDGEFRAIQDIWRRDGEALGRVAVPTGASSSSAYQVHPAFLDACSRVLAAAVDRGAWEQGAIYLPAGAAAFRNHRPCDKPDAWSHVVLRESANSATLNGDVRIYDSDGVLCAEIEGLRLQRLDSERQPTLDIAPFLYRRDWKPLAAESATSAQPPGHWLILADKQGVGTRLAAQLGEAGHTCSLIFSDAPASEWSVIERPLKGVVHLWSLDVPRFDVAARQLVSASVLEILKALARQPALSQQTRLWFVTSGAMPVLEGQSIAVAQSPLWGLGRALAVEHPQWWGGLIDLDPHDLANIAVLDAILGPGGEDMLAVRGGQRYVARIVRDDREQPSKKPLRIHANATYLITGGTGGLGLRLASWLHERGAGAVALLSRSEPQPAAAKALKQIDAKVFRSDVSQRDELAQTLAAIARSMPPLAGVFHLAGTLDDALLLDQDAERFYRAGVGKAEGAWNLHALTADRPLDHFVMFSSMASLVATSGQGNYAAANSVLDAIAHLRHAEGKPALTINWGPWSEIGHAATDYGRRAHDRLALLGVGSLTPDFSLAALERLMSSGVAQAAAINVDWSRLFRADPAAAASPLLRELVEPLNEPAQRETQLVANLKACAPSERADLVRSVLAEMIAQSLRLPGPESVKPTQSVFDLGLDSMLALELTNRISTAFGGSFRATMLFTHSTLDAAASFILSKVLPATDEPAPLSKAASIDDSGELTEEQLSRLIAEEIGAQ